MTNVFYAHSFDFYATADMNAMGWTAAASTAAVSYTIGNFGRNDTQGLRLARLTTADAAAIATAKRAYPTTQTPINGFAFRTNAYPPVSRLIAQVLDGSTSQLDFLLLANGTIQVQRASVVLGTSTFVLALNRFYYLEFKPKIDNATGTVDILVDEGNFESFSILSLSSVDTQVTGNASSDGINLCHQASDVSDISTNDFDDFYHTDPADAVYPAPIGNIYVLPQRANASGLHHDLTQVGAAVDYQAVNERLEDSDTTYIKTTGINMESSFPHTTIALKTDVLAVVLTHVSKVNSGSAAVAPAWVIGGGDFIGTPVGIASSYAAYPQAYTQSPASGVQWITPELNSGEIAVKVTS